VLAACTGDAASPSPASPSPAAPPTAADLDGRTFLSTGATGVTLVEGSQVRLMFTADTISAQAGCNSMGGGYSLTDGVLDLGMLATTEMACEEPLMRQDQWLAGFLDGAAASLDGSTLMLANGDATLTLGDREVADPDRPLVGTRWLVDGLINADAVSSMPAGVTAALTFADDRVDVEAGCNTGSGPVTIGDSTIAFGPILTTRMACGEAAMSVEQAILGVLAGDVTYAVEADSLTLTNGASGLTLRAQP
jgi:heat shock protein HslJ